MASARRKSSSASLERLNRAECPRQNLEVAGDVRVVWGEGVLVVGQSPPKKRFGLRRAVRRIEQHAEVAQALRDVWVIGFPQLLPDGERPAKQRLGLGSAVGVKEHEREAGEAMGHHRLIGIRRRFQDGQRAASMDSASHIRLVSRSSHARLKWPHATVG